MPDATALELYRITQEAVGNAVKHSGATDIGVELNMTQDTLTLTITDNGSQGSQQGGSGIGRRTMKQRAEAAGGKLTVNRHAGGTTLNVVVHRKA